MLHFFYFGGDLDREATGIEQRQSTHAGAACGEPIPNLMHIRAQRGDAADPGDDHSICASFWNPPTNRKLGALSDGLVARSACRKRSGRILWSVPPDQWRLVEPHKV